MLDPTKNDNYGLASREALLAYATHIESRNPKLAEDLRRWVGDIYKELDKEEGK